MSRSKALSTAGASPAGALELRQQDGGAQLKLDQGNPCLLYLAGLSPGSRPTMVSSLRRVSERFFAGQPPAQIPWAELRHVHVAAIRSWLAETYAPSTGNRIVCAIRGILKRACVLGQISDLDYRRAIDVQQIRGYRLPPGRSLSPGELRALFDACDRATILGIRNAAVLAVLYGCGLRRAELVSLELSSWDGEVSSLTVQGKGNKDRKVYAPEGTKLALSRWLERRGDDPGPLFLPTSHGGSVLEAASISKSALLKILRSIAKRAGVGSFTPHDLRRTFVGDLLDAGADLATVQALAGHAHPTTTARYDRRGERVKAEAAGLLFVPLEPD